jgi:hypothetical protein
MHRDLISSGELKKFTEEDGVGGTGGNPTKWKAACWPWRRSGIAG